MYAGMCFYGEEADAVLTTIDKLRTEVDKDEYWNVDSAQGQFCECLSEVDLNQPASIKSQAQRVFEIFSAEPKTCYVDLLISGVTSEWHDLKFGKLTFSSDVEELLHGFGVSPFTSPTPANFRIPPMLAHIEVNAIDKAAVLDKASASLARHLAILNAVCSQEYPSRTRLVEGLDFGRAHKLYRISGCDEDGFNLKSANDTYALKKSHFDSAMEKRGGKRLSNLLANPNDFGNRLLAAYVMAGTACIDLLPQRAFMFFAIALESAVLGPGKMGEISFQLTHRVAHLIGGDLEAKKEVVKQVRDIYGKRSRIAHAGEKVSLGDVVEIRYYCLTTLLAMTISPVFESMISDSDLEEWFSDRILDGSRHLPVETSSNE